MIAKSNEFQTRAGLNVSYADNVVFTSGTFSALTTNHAQTKNGTKYEFTIVFLVAFGNF